MANGHDIALDGGARGHTKGFAASRVWLGAEGRASENRARLSRDLKMFSPVRWTDFGLQQLAPRSPRRFRPHVHPSEAAASA